MNMLFYAAATLAGIFLLVFLFTSFEGFRRKRHLIHLQARQERKQTYLDSESQHQIKSGVKPAYNEDFSSDCLRNMTYVNANTQELWRISNPAVKISLEPRVVPVPQYLNIKPV